MRKRHNQILAGVLAIQVILSVAIFWPRSAATGAGEPLFPDLKADDVIALAVTDADGNSTKLRQVAGDWVLPDADDYPGAPEKITALLDKIVGLTTGRLVTRTDASHKRLQVSSDDFVRRIDFETAEGAKHTLYLGSSPSYGATHFRVEGQSEAYLTDAISVWETTASADSWIDTTYLSIPQADVTSMRLENSNGAFTFTKGDDGSWTMAGLAADEQVDEAKVTSTLRAAASVNMLGPLGREEKAAYGMEEPNAVVTLEAGDKTVTLRVGAEDTADGGYVVTSSESPYYVRVSDVTVRSLVESTRDDFLQQPPTPTPEADTGAP